MTTQEKLDRLTNRSTLYETVARHRTTGQTVLIGYCDKSVSRFYRSLASQVGTATRGEHLAALTGSDRMIPFDKYDRERFPLDISVRYAPLVGQCGDWLIGFTGRTQRQAIIEGEHPFIGSDFVQANLVK